MKCPRCNGPAVIVQQTKELSCVAQCDEGVVNMARRVALEESVAMLARRLGSEMRPGVGFTLILFDYGTKGSMAYASTGERDGMRSMLREMLDKLESETP